MPIVYREPRPGASPDAVESEVDLVGEYKASPFKPNGFVKGVKPEDLAIK